MHNNTVWNFHYRGDLTISAIRCGEKIYIYIYQYRISTKRVVKYQQIGYRQKIQYCASPVNINNFLCSIWKKCHNTHRQLIVSDVV